MCQRTIEQAPRFKRDLKKLRRHQGLPSKVQDTLNSLASGKIPDGDQLPGFGGRPIFKIRCGTGNMGRRKSARIIYYKDNLRLFALRIYLKNDKDRVPDKDIMTVLEKYVL